MEEGSYSILKKIRIVILCLIITIIFYLSLLILDGLGFLMIISGLSILIELALILYYNHKFEKCYKDDMYMENGYLKDWYEKTKDLMGTEWIKDIFDKLVENEMIHITDECITFVSTSANKGVYEKILFNHLSDKRINSKFIISDLCSIKGHEKYLKNNYGEYTYNENRNAKELNKYVKSANIIWDFKGCLWYCLPYKQNRKNAKTTAEEIKNTLEVYKTALDKDGLIVIDDIHTNLLKRKLAFNIFSLTNKLIYFVELSTVDKIKRLLSFEDNEVQELNRYINKNFDKISIESTHKNIAVLILKKK